MAVKFKLVDLSILNQPYGYERREALGDSAWNRPVQHKMIGFIKNKRNES